MSLASHFVSDFLHGCHPPKGAAHLLSCGLRSTSSLSWAQPAGITVIENRGPRMSCALGAGPLAAAMSRAGYPVTTRVHAGMSDV